MKRASRVLGTKGHSLSRFIGKKINVRVTSAMSSLLNAATCYELRNKILN